MKDHQRGDGSELQSSCEPDRFPSFQNISQKYFGRMGHSHRDVRRSKEDNPWLYSDLRKKLHCYGYYLRTNDCEEERGGRLNCCYSGRRRKDERTRESR